MGAMRRQSCCLFCQQASDSTSSSSSLRFSTSSITYKDVSKAVKETKPLSTTSSVIAENERIRQLLLDRDGGSASVPTRDGKWDQEMGRETSRHMHRILDQNRMNKPGTSVSVGEGESRERFK